MAEPPAAGGSGGGSSRRRAAVLGSPIAHSLSPLLHRTAYAALGLHVWDYAAVEVAPEGLPAFLDGLDESWVGLSLTMPLKQAVLPLLDEVSELARLVGAVNTVTFEWPARRRTGDNTDIPGMQAALAEAGVSVSPYAAVLGAGATACSAVVALAGRGVQRVVLAARRPTATDAVRVVAERAGVGLEVVGWDAAADLLEAPLAVATTPAGATDGLAGRVPAAPGTLFEVVYHPWPTPLAGAWAERGGVVVGGLDLLVHQAVRQVGLFLAGAGARVTPDDLDELVPLLRRVGEQELAARAAH